MTVMVFSPGHDEGSLKPDGGHVTQRSLMDSSQIRYINTINGAVFRTIPSESQYYIACLLGVANTLLGAKHWNLTNSLENIKQMG
eukprot:m.783779 g.783779  ORF g.783779 m.783779 type:complete len:85 (-) comp23295_c0_seq7:1956-2210(-)